MHPDGDELRSPGQHTPSVRSLYIARASLHVSSLRDLSPIVLGGEDTTYDLCPTIEQLWLETKGIGVICHVSVNLMHTLSWLMNGRCIL